MMNATSGTTSEEQIVLTITNETDAALLTPDSDPDKPSRLRKLGISWFHRYRRLGNLSDIEEACACLEQVVELTVGGQPDKLAACLNDLGISRQSRFKRLGDLADLDKAIECASRAVELAADGHPDKPGHLSNLGNSLQLRFERLGHLADIDKAIECMAQALELIPQGHSSEPTILSNLGVSCSARFEQLGNLADIDRAIECQSRAAELTPDSHLDKPNILNNLGGSRLNRFQQLGHLTDIEKAIECISQAVELAPDSHPDKPGSLNNLGGSWLCRFERLGDATSIDKAIEYQARAVELTPDGRIDKPVSLNNLANSLRARFNQLGDLTDIEKAIECASRVVELTPEGDPDKPFYLSNLGISMQCRFERLGRLTDIDRAIKYISRAVELTPDGHPNKPGTLNNLGESWRIRFEERGNIIDIDKAIEFMSQAVELAPEGYPTKPAYLSNLGNSWVCRFNRLGDLADLDKAIECHSRAVELTPDGHSDKSRCLNNLGLAWQNRFERLEILADIDKAIACASQAVKLTPDGHPDRPSRLSNLGNSWGRRFEQLSNLADNDKAIELQSQAVKLAPDSHPDKAGCLYNLGNSWRCRFKLLGNVTDIDTAIEFRSRAVELTSDDHPNKPSYLKGLGASWQARFERYGRIEDLAAAAQFFQYGAELAISSPSTQLRCARLWATHSFRLGHSPLSAHKRAFSLLPRLVSLGQTVQERYHSLLSINDLAAEAAAWAVSVGLHDLALEWLEQGRSVVWSQTLQLRTPFDELAKVDPDLADCLRDTASQLDVASSRSNFARISMEPQQNVELQARRHRYLAELWDELLTKARQLPGYDGFMLPRTSAELKRAATDGPVVVINTHSTRCDALVIFPDCHDVTHIPLSILGDKKLVTTCSQVMSLVGRWGSARGVKYFPLADSHDHLQPLANLWLGVVEPVLNTLERTCTLSKDNLPHVTWCATGALSSLPLHAAGLYNGQSPNAFDLVVSSYTPTLSALLPRSDQTAEQAHGVLAVGQANAPGQPALPMTVEELAIVKKHIDLTIYHQLDGALVTVEATLNAMEQHSWVHLACHALQNRDNPSHSAFYLYDGCLTLEEITKRHFKNKGLAFLSACQTATGDNSLPDEATHLAAGMLTAGYPSVIATMWSIRDEDAPQIADGVYAELMKEGKLNYRNTAVALHKAIGKLRETVGLESIDRWAAFIHVGV